jgi:hypothetical protein
MENIEDIDFSSEVLFDCSRMTSQEIYHYLEEMQRTLSTLHHQEPVRPISTALNYAYSENTDAPGPQGNPHVSESSYQSSAFSYSSSPVIESLIRLPSTTLRSPIADPTSPSRRGSRQSSRQTFVRFVSPPPQYNLNLTRTTPHANTNQVALPTGWDADPSPIPVTVELYPSGRSSILQDYLRGTTVRSIVEYHQQTLFNPARPMSPAIDQGCFSHRLRDVAFAIQIKFRQHQSEVFEDNFLAIGAWKLRVDPRLWSFELQHELSDHQLKFIGHFTIYRVCPC